jgi:hypothetical protein
MDAAEPDPDLVGRKVIDAGGRRMGRLDGLYRDVDDPTVFFAAVAMIRRGRRRLVFVPLSGAKIDRTSIRLRCGGLLARRAPQTRPGRELPVELEADLYQHYDIPYQPREDGSARLHLVLQRRGRR